METRSGKKWKCKKRKDYSLKKVPMPETKREGGTENNETLEMRWRSKDQTFQFDVTALDS